MHGVIASIVNTSSNVEAKVEDGREEAVLFPHRGLLLNSSGCVIVGNATELL